MSSINVSQYLDKCLISGRPVTKILDFGQHAYADTFIAENQLNLSEPVFPLQVNLCADSGMIQLGYVSNAVERYNLYAYSYTSSNSKTARDHWTEYADSVKNRFDTTGLVVEVGSNDGFLIKQFKQDGTQVLGVDTSATMCEIAELSGVPTLHKVFGDALGGEIKNTYGPAQVVMANNVFNHSNDPVGFARGVKQLLGEGGVFVFELPYWAEMVKSKRFTDMVYHEHVSYFTIKGAWNLLKEAGLELFDYDIVDYHGGSIRGYACPSANPQQSEKIQQAIEYETKIGLFDPVMYLALQSRFELDRANWMTKFYQLQLDNPGAVFIGVGAAAKANTWLTWHGLNKSHLDCITDASEHKQGKYTPLSRIPIHDDNEFAKHDNVYALILSWNIGEPLKKALLSINPNVKFISQ